MRWSASCATTSRARARAASASSPTSRPQRRPHPLRAPRRTGRRLLSRWSLQSEARAMKGGGMIARMLRAGVVWVAFATLLAGCASDPPGQPQQLNFVDSKLFDDQLHDALATDAPTVTVNITGEGVTVNRIPERLDTWVYLLVDRYEGKIQMVPDPSATVGKGIEGIAIGLAIGAYTFASE